MPAWIVLISLLLALVPGSAMAQSVEELVAGAMRIGQTSRILDTLTSGDDLDEEALAGARVKYQGVIANINDAARMIGAESEAIAERLTEIGPPPENEETVESPEVVQARDRLTGDKTSLVVALTNLEELRDHVQSRIDAISLRRQQLFTEAISKRTLLTGTLLTRALGDLKSEWAAARSLFANWITFLYQERFWEALASVLIALAAAIVLSYYFRRYFGPYLERRQAEPDYVTRAFIAFWRTVLPSAATAVFLGASYALFDQFGLYSSKVAEIVYALIIAIIGAVFAWNFCRAVFAPKASNWRLIGMSDSAAAKMFALTFALFAAYLLDYFLSAVNTALSGGLAVTVLIGVIGAVVMGSILVIMALIDPHDRSHGPDDDRSGWPRWISLPLIIVGGIIVLSAIAGYVGFARFIDRQVVVTGAIAAIMVIGVQAARGLSIRGVLAKSPFGRFLESRGFDEYRIEQISLAAAIGFIAFILLTGIPLILMQWGTHYTEITTFFRKALTGIDIGGLRISLTGILAGFVVFIVVLTITRAFQRWLSRSVFPRSRVDVGVRDSIKAGVGYTGIGLAMLMAVTTAGFDLSSLAIVAGALSLGIGFGLQNVVNNFVSGLILLVERPIKTGDWIEVGAANGIVKRISVRATEIETFQKKSVIVPNSELINSQVGNWTHKSTRGRIEIPIGVSYDADTRLVERILYEIADNHAMVAKKPEPYVWFVDFGASSLDFQLRVHLPDIMNSLVVQTEIRFEIQRRFAQAGIEIPFPQQDTHLKLPQEMLAAPAAKAKKKPAAAKPTAPKPAPKPAPKRTRKAPKKTAPDG